MTETKTNYILLTRPSSDSLKMQKQLTAPTLVSPMLIVKKLINKLTIPPQTTDIIITSARIFELYPEVAELPYRFWCVGGVSANIARKLGIKNLKSASGTVGDLILKISQEVQSENSYLVHLSGETLYRDVIAELSESAFKGERLILYSTESVTQLTPEVLEGFKQQQIKVTAFYSYKSAATFAELVEKSQLNDGFASCFCLTLSENIASAIEHLPWQQLIVKSDLSAADLQDFYMKQVPQLTETKARSMPTLLGAAAIGGLVAALTFLGVEHLSKSPVANPSEAQLEPIIKQLHDLEAQIRNPNATAQLRFDELSRNIEDLKIQQQKQGSNEGSKENLKTHQLMQLITIENAVAKFSNLHSTVNELENALNLLMLADITLDDSQKQMFTKRPIVSMSQLLATFPAAERSQNVVIPIPNNFKKYLGDIKIEHLSKDDESQQQQIHLLVQRALQNKDYNVLKEMLSERREQPEVIAWLENVANYFAIVQALNNIQQQLHSS